MKLFSSLHQKIEGTGLDTLYIYYHRHRGRGREAVIRDYLGDNVSEKEIKRISRRMRYAFLRYGWKFDEYFEWHFEELTHKERKSFVPDLHKDYFCDMINPKQGIKVFMDKGLTYQKFRPFYKRDVCAVKSWEKDGSAFADFIHRHPTFIVKPLTASMGNGVQIFRDCNASAAEDICKSYPEGLIAEELIVQVDELKEVFPHSVNTVRITTLILKDETVILHPFIRFGRGENIVDNGGQGGLFCAIDPATGRVTAVRDKHSRAFEQHPETGHQLIGFTVPRWKEACDLALQLAQVYPECRYVGWDLALTNDGWVMVEGNSRGQFIGFQLPALKGFRSEFEQLKSRL